MDSARSRSPPPEAARRRRSRSPDHDRASRPKNRGGFRWKDKRQRDDRYRDNERRLDRGYRERRRSQSPRRERSREMYGDRNRARDYNAPPRPDRVKDGHQDSSKPKPMPKKAPAVTPGEEMIVVHVNDRLGTKAAIPCLASDPIKLFKAQVAARIGREPHEILLKRQGERPFKDQLTLQDYGVSNGVQIDLEVDTGD